MVVLWNILLWDVFGEIEFSSVYEAHRIELSEPPLQSELVENGEIVSRSMMFIFRKYQRKLIRIKNVLRRCPNIVEVLSQEPSFHELSDILKAQLETLLRESVCGDS